MSTDIKIQLKQCFELLAKIRAAYPDGEFDREMLHGDMDFRYRQIKEMREKLEALPKVVHDFARFKNALRAPDEAVKSFFHSVLEEPENFTYLVGIGFKQRREELQEVAVELETAVRHIEELLTRTRLAGVLDAEYKLNKDYRNVIAAFLAL
jgi:hypothetical protein